VYSIIFSAAIFAATLISTSASSNQCGEEIKRALGVLNAPASVRAAAVSEALELAIRAQQVLGRKLKPDELVPMIKAHMVGHGQMGKDGIRAAQIGNYTKTHIAEKTRILKEAGFTEDERRKLIESGIVGFKEGLDAGLKIAEFVSYVTGDVKGGLEYHSSRSYLEGKPVEGAVSFLASKVVEKIDESINAAEHASRSTPNYVPSFRASEASATFEQITRIELEANDIAEKLSKGELSQDEIREYISVAHPDSLKILINKYYSTPAGLKNADELNQILERAININEQFTLRSEIYFLTTAFLKKVLLNNEASVGTDKIQELLKRLPRESKTQFAGMFENELANHDDLYRAVLTSNDPRVFELYSASKMTVSQQKIFVEELAKQPTYIISLEETLSNAKEAENILKTIRTKAAKGKLRDRELNELSASAQESYEKSKEAHQKLLAYGKTEVAVALEKQIKQFEDVFNSEPFKTKTWRGNKTGTLNNRQQQLAIRNMAMLISPVVAIPAGIVGWEILCEHTALKKYCSYYRQR
jgi:hypothetical protein